MRALTRVATAETEDELLVAASIYTASQLERVVRTYRRVSVKEARQQQEAAQLAVFWNPDGSLELHGRLAPEDGALLLRALEAVRESLWRGSAEPRPARQASNAEALVALADRALAHEGGERTGGDRYQVVVHADEDALAEDGDGGCELEDGSALCPETARPLACDASVVRDGRKARTIPPAIRRELRRRDRGCHAATPRSSPGATATSRSTPAPASQETATRSTSTSRSTTWARSWSLPLDAPAPPRPPREPRDGAW